MNDFLIDTAISAVISLVTRYVPKDKAVKSKWKKALLKVFKAIAVAYKDDEDFQID